MNIENVKRKLKSLKLNLEVHPDTEPNSEFEDRINDIDSILEFLDEAEIKTPLQQLEEFQKTFNSTFSEKPTFLKTSDWELRVKLSQEELNEYKEACEENDMVEILDALLDRQFLILGDVVSHGMQGVFWKGFNEVVKSNMSKLDDNGKPLLNGVNCTFDPSRPFGKIIKSENFFEPNLKQFLDGVSEGH